MSTQDRPDLFVNPLLFVRLGNTYFGRVCFNNYVSDCSEIVDVINPSNDNIIFCSKKITGLSDQLNQMVSGFYTTITFSY